MLNQAATRISISRSLLDYRTDYLKSFLNPLMQEYYWLSAYTILLS
jgi:hypothetical protein